MPLPRKTLALIPLAGALVGVAGWARPEAAPPPATSASASAATAADRYEAVRARGAPVAVLRRPTVLRLSPGGRRVARLRKRTGWGSPRVLPALARDGGWLQVIASELPNGRTGWIPMSATQLVANQWAMSADLSTRLVTVRKSGRVVRRFHVAIGRRGTPTPTGRFAVTDKLELMSRSAAYGCCALALSGHQPHVAQGWTGGNRLAIHGTSAPRTIGSAASLGCLRARNRDARWIIRHVWLGTIVEIRR